MAAAFKWAPDILIFKSRILSICGRRYVPYFVLGAILVSGLIPANRSAGADQEKTSKERSAAFAWFSKLGFPDVKDARFVRVVTGNWSQQNDDPPVNSYRHGFLLSQMGDTFTVLFPDLSTRRFTKSSPDTKEHKRVDFELKDLPEFATGYLQAIRDADDPKRKPDDWPRRFGERLAERAEVFVLAWGCWRKGHDQAAVELYQQATRIPNRRDDVPSENFQQSLATDIAHAEMWRAVLKFGDADVSRTQLLEAFERIVKNYQASEHIAQATETVILLKKMIQEDAAHAEERKSGKPFEELSRNEQIAELIFQLRDQNGHQWSQPGSCDVFMTADGDDKSPAHRLVKMGYDAMPQLIEALDNERFSRSVGFHRGFYFSHTVLRVSDCAQQIVTRIAGRPFYQRKSTSGYMHADGQSKDTKQQVSAWYAELQKKGEKRVLLEATEVGDRHAAYLAERLVEKYPDEALSALIAGARKANETWIRADLVRLAGQIKGDTPVEFLLEELKNGPTSDCRLAAAKAIHKRGRPEGVVAMLAEWKRPPEKVTDESEGIEESLVSFLARCGKLEAIEALSHDLEERPIDVRLAVVSAFGKTGNMSVLSVGTGDSLRPGQPLSAKDDKELRAAVIHMLIVALDDTEQRMGMSGSWNGKSFSDPRICDVAGNVLNDLDPAEYPFDMNSSLEQRDRDRLSLKNVFRKDQGLPALAIPEPRPIKPVPDGTLLPKLEQYEKAIGEAAKSAELAILKLGLGALPAIIERRDQLTVVDPRIAKLNLLARRLSLLVVDVAIAEKSLKPDMVLSDRLKSLKDKPFDPQVIQELLSELTRKLPEGVRGLRLAVDRGSNGTGVTLRLDLLNLKRASTLTRGGRPVEGDKAPLGEPDTWSFSQSVRLGTESLLGSSGVGIRPPGVKEDSDFSEIMQRIVTAQPDQVIEIRLEMIGKW